MINSRDQHPRSPPSQQKAAAGKTFETVRQLWSGLLLVDAEDIVEDADFFELGGTSIEAVEFIQQLEAQTRTAITLRDFMQSPTPGHVLGMMLAEEGGGSPGTPPEHHMPRLNALDAVSPFRRTWLLNIGQLLGLVMLVYIWFAPAVLSVRALFWVSDELSLSMYAAVALVVCICSSTASGKYDASATASRKVAAPGRMGRQLKLLPPLVDVPAAERPRVKDGIRRPC